MSWGETPSFIPSQKKQVKIVFCLLILSFWIELKTNYPGSNDGKSYPEYVLLFLMNVGKC